MDTKRTNQTAYVGKYALEEIQTGKLIHGGGVTAPRPRLYKTEEDVRCACRNLRWADTKPVRLI
jgi:hypothetical protein